MSKRMMTTTILSKLNKLTFAFIFTFVMLFSLSKYNAQQNFKIQLLSSCKTLETKLPMNHVNHPCQASGMSNKTWLSWLSGDSKSTHLHFLDLAELLHYSFH